MNVSELKSLLQANPAARPQFTLPDGDVIPTHFHITEVGHVTKRFIDCGGMLHDQTSTCLLQAYVGEDVDHRLDAATFAKILALGAKVLPHDDLPVEIEYDCCVVAHYPIDSATVADGVIEFQLGSKHTDCLAKRRREAAAGSTAVAAGCCS